MKVEESLNVTFDESPPPTKLSPLVDDDVGEEEAIRNITKVVNNKRKRRESIEVDKVINFKESKNHPLDQVIGNLNQRTLRSQAQDHINFFCFISTIEPRDVNKALKDDEVSGGEDSKPTKTPMSLEIKLTKDNEADSVDSSKYQENPKTTHLEAVKPIFSAGFLGDRKSTSGVCTSMGCCLTSWFAKQQMALAISTTKAEYVSAGKACQQALWMKQEALGAECDYGHTASTTSRIYMRQEGRTKMPSEYQQDYKKTHAYVPKIYNDPNMTEELRDIYRALESRYLHEGTTIDPSFYRDLSDDSVAKFTNIGFDCLLSLDEQICPRRMYFFKHRRDKLLPYDMILTRLFKNLKANMADHLFDERYALLPRKMSSFKAKQHKKPPPKRTRNVGKSYSRALPPDPIISKEQKETRGIFKNLGRALHEFEKMLKKGRR
ncbi:hypothetical protein Tco_0778747 [Tanacetum coccineum]